MKIKIVTIGKIKEKIYRERVQEYLKWISKYSQIQIITLKENNQEKLNKNLLKYLNSDSFTICLSEEGKQKNSIQFSRFLHKQNREIIFIIGGPKGHPKFVSNLSNKTLSLSKMTFLHEMSILILCEQIFRGISINNNKNYHK
mgnify:CR=1 FL=1